MAEILDNISVEMNFNSHIYLQAYSSSVHSSIGPSSIQKKKTLFLLTSFD